MLISSETGVFAMAASKLTAAVQKAGDRVQVAMQLRIHSAGNATAHSRTIDPSDLDKVVQMGFRVVLAMADSRDVLAMALAAKDRGMMTSGWAWLGLDTVAGAETFGIDLLGSPGDLKAAMDGWVFFEPSNTAPTAFFERVREETREHFPQQQLDSNNISLSTAFAANMYDAVLLYAQAARSTVSRQSDPGSVIRAMMRTSFDGMTGRVELDERGDMKESIRVMNYFLRLDGSMGQKQVGLFDAVGGGYSTPPNGTVVWPGGVVMLPSDFAASASDNAFNTTWLLFGAGCAAAVFMGGLVAFVRRRHAHLQAILALLFTEVGETVGSFCLELADLITDMITGVRLLQSATHVRYRYKLAYAVVLCSGAIGTSISLGYRLRAARAVRAHVQELSHSQRGIAAVSNTRRQLQKYEYELLQLSRTRITLSLALLNVAAEGAAEMRASMGGERG